MIATIEWRSFRPSVVLRTTTPFPAPHRLGDYQLGHPRWCTAIMVPQHHTERPKRLTYLILELYQSWHTMDTPSGGLA
jgi:hypothetical protein